jgi:hypothetical protein
MLRTLKIKYEKIAHVSLTASPIVSWRLGVRTKAAQNSVHVGLGGLARIGLGQWEWFISTP